MFVFFYTCMLLVGITSLFSSTINFHGRKTTR